MAHIFVVDDDEQLLRMIGLMLERGGHVATLVNHPLEALERIKDERPDMAILDVMMPAMNGHDLCRALRTQEATKQMPVMILTARAQEYDRQTAMDGGADDYLSKPVTSQELLARVDRLLAQRHTTHSLAIEAKIIAFFGLSGGAGRTTLAVNLAAQLRTTTQTEVCLVDFNISGAQLAMHLRLQPKVSWANILNNGTELGWSSIEPQLQTHESGVKILSAPTSPIPPGFLSAETTMGILDTLRNHHSFVVVDLPAMLSESVRGTLQMADLGLHVLRPDIISIQTAVRTDRTLRSVGVEINRINYLFNQVTPDPQISKSAAERGLNETIPYKVDYDTNQARALMQGNPLCFTPIQSPLPRSVQKVATAVWQRAATDTG